MFRDSVNELLICIAEANAEALGEYREPSDADTALVEALEEYLWAIKGDES